MKTETPRRDSAIPNLDSICDQNIIAVTVTYKDTDFHMSRPWKSKPIKPAKQLIEKDLNGKTLSWNMKNSTSKD